MLYSNRLFTTAFRKKIVHVLYIVRTIKMAAQRMMYSVKRHFTFSPKKTANNDLDKNISMINYKFRKDLQCTLPTKNENYQQFWSVCISVWVVF